MSDPFFSNVTLLLHGNGFANNSPIVDSSSAPSECTKVNSAAMSTTFRLFGNRAIYFPTATAYLQVAPSAKFDFGSDDFTIETSARYSSLSTDPRLLYMGVGATPVFELFVSAAGALNLVTSGGSFASADGAFLAAQFHSVAVTRTAGLVRVFLDGILIGSYTDITALAQPTVIRLNAKDAGIFGQVSYHDEMRITKGVSRYTADYTLATAQFPDVGVTTVTATGFNTTTFGTPGVPAAPPGEPAIVDATGFQSGSFGTPSAPYLARATTIARTSKFGTPARRFDYVANATGFNTTAFGRLRPGIFINPARPAADRRFRIAGILTTKFGTPST